jgi:predicted DCC family thiol-disulfide oxidoreductase YuxK
MDVNDNQDSPVIIFDAKCVLCSSNAQFILKHDKAGHFRLASMQGEYGAALYRKYGMDPADPISIIIIEGNTMRQDSDAVLSIYEALGFPWNLFSIMRIVPAIVRDPIYRWIARNRYRWFGERESCWISPSEYKNRIL